MHLDTYIVAQEVEVEFCPALCLFLVIESVDVEHALVRVLKPAANGEFTLSFGIVLVIQQFPLEIQILIFPVAADSQPLQRYHSVGQFYVNRIEGMFQCLAQHLCQGYYVHCAPLVAGKADIDILFTKELRQWLKYFARRCHPPLVTIE